MMKRFATVFCLGAIHCLSAVHAAEYSLDFSSATACDAESPVLRRAEMSVAVGAVPAVAVGDRLDLKLFSDVAFALKIVAAPPAGIAGQSFIARDENGSASAIVKVTDTSARISVDDYMNRRQYTVRCKDGKAAIFERDNSQTMADECGTCTGQVDESPAEATPAKTTKLLRSSAKLLAASSGGDGNAFEVATHKSVVDILVAFDQGAKEWALRDGDGWDSLELCAEDAIQRMNDVLRNSNLYDAFCYRLAGVTEIDGAWTAVTTTLLNNLRARNGVFSKLNQLRNKYGADTITLLVNRTSGNTSGYGYGYYPVSSFPNPSVFDGGNNACNVCDINTTFSRYTMSHETGHNMGCDHSNRQGSNSGPGRYDDSSGYHFVDATGVRRYTIMGYGYTSDDDYSYEPVPYFSAPDMTFYASAQDTEGCPLGVEGVNNNRGTLLQTHSDIAGLREHVKPYDWDVKFFDDNGNEIPDGTYFWSSCYVTLSNDNPQAEIYYTLDGTTPNKDTTTHGTSGTKVYMYLATGPKTLTACAVTNGVAQSIRSITLRDGLTWSGDENGNGDWVSSNSSEKPWSGEYFAGDSVLFPDLAGISSATVTVQDALSPASVSFKACETAYTFDKGSDTSQITIPDAAFAPAGDITFNVPVKLNASSITFATAHNIAFNAPFGQTLDSTNGYCTTAIVVGHYGQLTVAPRSGKTQKFDKFSTSTSYSTSTVRFGEGTVEFNSDGSGGDGVFGNAQVVAEDGCNLVFNGADTTGYSKTSSMTINKGGTVTFNNYDTLRRPLNLNGGTLRMNVANRLDWFNGTTITVTDDSLIEGVEGSWIHVRKEKQSNDTQTTVTVAADKTLTVDMVIGDNPTFFTGDRLVKDGNGEILVKKTITHGTAIVVNAGTFTIDYSCPTSYGTGWTVSSGAKLKVKKDRKLTVPSLALADGAILDLPSQGSAPLVVNGDVDLTGVTLLLQDAENLTAGVVYPLVSTTGSFSGVKDVKMNFPKLDNDLKWGIEVDDNVLCAKVLEKSALEKAVAFCSNVESLTLSAPDDATVNETGGATIATKPYVVDGLDTKAVSIAVKFTVPETVPSSYAAICSWKLGDYVIYCIRETDGKLNCRWGDKTKTLQTTANQTNSVDLAAGEHLLQIGYYSNSNNGGTRVLLDGKVAYVASGLKFSSEDVSKVTFGASAEDSLRYSYAGLVIKEVAVLDVISTEAPPRMTASGGDVSYALNVPGVIPRIFPLTPCGAVAMNESMLPASFSGTYDNLSVSVVAAFPTDAVGTILSAAVDANLSNPYSTQVEYRGNGVFAFRDNGYNELKTSVQTSANVAVKHLYTLTYTKGYGYKLFIDGSEILTNNAYYNGKAFPATARVSFGCGYWSDWLENWNDYPNPISNLKIYASHIALGTDDRTVSEAEVESAMSGGEGGDEPDDPEEPEPVVPATPATVDVLVAYDIGAQTYVANKIVTLEEFAQTQITRMNDVLATNRLNRFYSYRLAGVCKVNATYSDINATTTLIAQGAGPCVSLRAAREMYGADTVTLLINSSGATLGNSSPLSGNTDIASRHEDAFSVCAISAVDSNAQHTMIHENAHNMGCGHSRNQGQNPGPAAYADYASGYYYTNSDNQKRHTIMAYEQGGYTASPYFSTASNEFGFKLGDSTNNNARVLKETCGEVAKWRENVKPFGNEAIVTVDGTGKEVLSGHVFANEIMVRLSVPTEYEGASIYYTFNGNNPTIAAYDGGEDWVFVYDAVRYPKLRIDANKTLSVAIRPQGTDYLLPVRKVNFTRCDLLANASNAVWQTSLKYPWKSDGDTIRSYNQTDYTYQCTTPLKATIVGPKRLSFQHKEYFAGASVAKNRYSHFDVLLDDSPVIAQTECTNDWTQTEMDIPEGTHEVSFVFSQRYAMNNPLDNKDRNAVTNDAVWLKDIRLKSKPEDTDDNFIVPGTDGWGVLVRDDQAVEDWLDDANFWMYEEMGTTWKDLLDARGENGYFNWQNFMIGYSPDDTRTFKAIVKIVNGDVIVSTTEDAIPAGYGIVKKLYLKKEMDEPWQVKLMSGKSENLGAAMGNGFYKVEVSFEAE